MMNENNPLKGIYIGITKLLALFEAFQEHLLKIPTPSPFIIFNSHIKTTARARVTWREENKDAGCFITGYKPVQAPRY